MFTRTLGIVFALTVVLAPPATAFAQAPAAPTPLYTGNLGGGFALTNGNTDTRTFNLTGAFVRDPKIRNVIKGTGSYLRGTQNDLLNLDRTAVNFRDEYTFTKRTYALGQLDYLRDQFKQIVFFWAPTAGLGFKIIDTDATQFTVDGGPGAVLEKNPGIESHKSGSIVAGQRFQQKLSSTAVFTEFVSSIWKTNDFGDSLTNFTAGLTTTVSGKLQLKLEFIDSYKNKPPNPGVKKNDTAFITAFVVKF